MPPSDSELRFGVVVKHPLQDLILMVLRLTDRDAEAMVLHDNADIHPRWTPGHIETIARKGWIILDEGIE